MKSLKSKYNKSSGVSEMTYNSQKKTITKKTKNKLI